MAELSLYYLFPVASSNDIVDEGHCADPVALLPVASANKLLVWDLVPAQSDLRIYISLLESPPLAFFGKEIKH